MNNIDKEFERRLEEEYSNSKPYLYDDDGNFDKDQNQGLYEMCKCCEEFCGNKHNFDECRNKPCFRFWLAYEYLHWITGYDVYGE